MTFVFVEFEDVMARPDQSPIPAGLRLVRALRSNWRMALSTGMTKDRAQNWLLVNGFPKDFFQYGYYRAVTEATLDDDDVFRAHLDMAQHNAPIELVVTASPARAAMAMRRSITALMYGSPATARPEFRPAKVNRAWSEIEEEVSKRRILTTKAVGNEADDDD